MRARVGWTETTALALANVQIRRERRGHALALIRWNDREREGKGTDLSDRPVLPFATGGDVHTF